MYNSKEQRTRALRYKRPALVSLGYDDIISELWEIQDTCGNIQCLLDCDEGMLLDALDGDEEEEWEFKMAFSDLSAKAEQLMEAVQEQSSYEGDQFIKTFDDCIVSLIGNRYDIVGYDGEMEDYFSLTSYEQGLACSEAGKRMMRRTKADMLSTIGQCLGILISFLDLRQQYDYLKATMDIVRDENVSLLQTIKEIDKAYETAAAVRFSRYSEETERFDSLLSYLPQRAWLE